MRSFNDLAVTIIVVSSAYNITFPNECTVNMSLTYKRYNVEPKIEPCGTPLVIKARLELAVLINV